MTENKIIVFPAHAGMSPVTWASPPTVNRFPRPRGDEPYPPGVPETAPKVFPAHAGMSPWSRPSTRTVACFPRPRGDEP